MLLVKFEKNWADEFDCRGFAIMSQRDFDEMMANMPLQHEVYFGTNEYWTEGEITADAFTATEISIEEADTIEKLFGKNAFGIWPNT